MVGAGKGVQPGQAGGFGRTVSTVRQVAVPCAGCNHVGQASRCQIDGRPPGGVRIPPCDLVCELVGRDHIEPRDRIHQGDQVALQGNAAAVGEIERPPDTAVGKASQSLAVGLRQVRAVFSEQLRDDAGRQAGQP